MYSVRKTVSNSSVFENCRSQKDWGFIEEPTYSKSIGSHVCITCTEFDYSIQEHNGSLLCCNCHQKLICNGQHLTHSCEKYQKKKFRNI